MEYPKLQVTVDAERECECGDLRSLHASAVFETGQMEDAVSQFLILYPVFTKADIYQVFKRMVDPRE